LKSEILTLPRITSFYLDYLHNHDGTAFVGQVCQYYSQSTLVRLASSLQVETRRAVAMILGFVGTYDVNPVLGGLLHDPDRSVRLLAEGSIKSVWPRDSLEEHRQQLREIMRLINNQHFKEAIRLANGLLDENPLFAEVRNQRAIAQFALGEYQDAIEDSEIVLDLNPYHFGAAIGMGHAYLQLKQRDDAVVCFQHALQINPNLEVVRRHLERIMQ
jgi:tetratricopeptide (TPR) repeat protein